MPKAIKILLKAAFCVFAAVLLAAILLPMLYTDKIKTMAKDQINRQINGTFAFTDASLSLFKHFPKWSLSLDSIEVVSYALSDSSRLFTADHFVIHIDFWSIWEYKKGINISGVTLHRPIIQFISDTSGQKNYNIIRKRQNEANTKETSPEMNIQHFEIAEGTVIFEDKKSATLARLENINHTSKLKYSHDLIDIKSKTHIQSLNVAIGGITYAKNIQFYNNSAVTNYLSTNKIIIRGNESRLNDFTLKCDGNITHLSNDKIELHLHISSPGSNFKELFSLLPSTYTKDYKNVVAEGDYVFNIKIDGIWDSKENLYPNFEAYCKVKNGTIQYPGKSVKLEQVQMDVLANNDDPTLKSMLIKIDPLRFTFAGEGFDMQLAAMNVLDNAKTDGYIKGSINLNSVKNFLPLEPGTQIGGKINADINFSFLKSDIQQEYYENTRFNGFIDFEDVIYQSSGLPSTKIPKASLIVDPLYAEIKKCDMQIGQSDLYIVGSIKKPLAILSNQRRSEAKLNVSSKKLDLNELLQTQPNAKTHPYSEVSQTPNFIKSIGGNIDFTCGELFYSTYLFRQTHATAFVEYDQIRIDEFTSTLNGNGIQSKGEINQVFQYMYDNKPLKGRIAVQGTLMDLDKLMAAPQGISVNAKSDATNSQAFAVPENMDISIDFNFEKIKYGDIALNQCKGNLSMGNQAIEFHDISARTMGGTMSLNGVYDSKPSDGPSFNLKYDLSKLLFSEIFRSVKSVRLIAPLAQFIEGNFNSTIACQGKFGKDMMPDLGSLNLDGIIETLDGAIKGFKPLEALASKLNMEPLKNLSIKNTRNWIHVENGKVSVREFSKKIDDIELKASGSHSIAGPMDYRLILRIPQNKFKQLGNEIHVEKGLHFVKNLAAKAGVDIKTGSHVNLLVNISGKLSAPDLQYKILGADGEPIADAASDMAKSVVDKAKDTLQKRAEQEVEKAKQKAMEEAKKLEDSLRAVAAKEAQKAKEKAMEELAKKTGMDTGLIKQGGDAIKSAGEKVMKEGGKSQIDSIKTKLKDWNPFKKN